MMKFINHRHQKTKQATLYGALKNIVLAILKVVLGITGHSHALVADGFHSFADLLTDLLVLLASHWGNQEADSNHPYGHQRIETAASMFLAFLLIIVGLAIGYEAMTHFLGKNSYESPHFYVLIVAFISTLFNEILFQYTHYTAKKIKSDLLMANAWHHRSDAASSLVVLMGVVGAFMGILWLDSVAACLVGLMIIKMGTRLAWTNICELVDTGVQAKILDPISRTISQTIGVQAIHQLRTRSMGGAIFVDVHILVDPRLSVSEGHYIAEQVYQNLKKKNEEVKDVTVHVDSEDDASVSQSLNLPPRKELLTLLKKHSDINWHQYSSEITIHYLEGKIFLDIYVDININKTELLNKLPILGGIAVYRTDDIKSEKKE